MAEQHSTVAAEQDPGLANQDEELSLEELEGAAGGTFSEPTDPSINTNACGSSGGNCNC
jgi:hypothetical protein